MTSKEVPSPKAFSFVEPCVRHWEIHRSLRRRALKMQRLVESSDPDTIAIPPSLANIKHNYEVLKGYTSHMAKMGVILTVHMKYLRPPIMEFYRLMEVEISDETARTFCHGTATIIKKMLHVIKRKWAKWEMPRAPGLKQTQACCRCLALRGNSFQTHLGPQDTRLGDGHLQGPRQGIRRVLVDVHQVFAVRTCPCQS